MTLKIPPPVIFLLSAGLMWLLYYYFPIIELPRSLWLVVLFILLGFFTALAGLWAFYRAKTTIDPLNPERASCIVNSGIYRFSRNPMYLGLVCVLIAWGIWLAQILVWLGVIVFMLYITYFQIKPEEAVLTEKFGETYQQYCGNVRRWI